MSGINNGSKVTTEPLRLDSNSLNYIRGLYLDEPVPIYEHNALHILGYLAYGKDDLLRLQSPNAEAVLANELGKLTIFTPHLLTQNLNWIEQISDIYEPEVIVIQNVSEHWYMKNADKFTGFESVPRSEHEVVYSTRVLTELTGKNFAKLRQTRNRLLSSGHLSFQSIHDDNMADALDLIRKWNAVQGYKYQKDKEQKEVYVVETFLSLCKLSDNYYGEIGYIDGVAQSLTIYLVSNRNPRWGIIYLLKGNNRQEDGGVRGATDATYLYVVSKLRSMGVEYINDGDLGKEKGTIEHKLRFKPVRELKSFDLTRDV